MLLLFIVLLHLVLGSNIGYKVFLNKDFKHGDRSNELNGGLCSDFKRLNGIDQCCAGRLDECYMIHYDTRCYCDVFCDRSESDCCEDAYGECANGTPIVFTTTATTTTTTRSYKGECTRHGIKYKSGELLKDNCNALKCDNGRWIGNEQRCLIDVDLMNKINSKSTSWIATNYSMFWAKSLEYGYRHRLGTKVPSKLQRPFDPFKTYKITLMDKKLDEAYDFRRALNDDGIEYADSIRDQGDCAASWAFSTIDVASDRLVKISKGRFGNSNYSTQMLISCSELPNKNSGCSQQSPDYAWNFLNHIAPNSGVVEESCYKYENLDKKIASECKIDAKSPICPSNGIKYNRTLDSLLLASPVYQLKVVCDADIMREIIMQGPVQAIFRVYPDFFMYKSGVYKWTGVADLNDEPHYHSVKILGWGKENGEDYWLCANSWSREFGEQGYFKIKRGDSEINNHIYAAWANAKINGKLLYNTNTQRRLIQQMYAAIKNM